MEYQKKARRGQLCILIYVLLIFVCSFISNATSFSSSPTTDSSNSAVFSASHSSSQLQSRTQSSTLSSSSLSSTATTTTTTTSATTNTTSPQLLSPLSQPIAQSNQKQQQQHQQQQLQPQLLQSSQPPFPTSHLSVFPDPAANIFPRSLVVAQLQSTSNSTTSTPPSIQSINQALSRQAQLDTATSNSLTNQSTLPSSIASSLSARNTAASSTAASKAKVCGGIHIRNDLKSFQQLEGCKIINGPLTIALVANINNPKDYNNITFPLLTEVTDYLLFFRVQNLTTLSKLFPNLRVIRGRELVSNYALIIYEMMHLQRIDLPSLTDILRGSVRIENNPNLCFASTVNWEAICKHKFTSHFIKDNNVRCNNRCPDHCHPWDPHGLAGLEAYRIEGDVSELGADNNRSLFCWNNQDCHESCPEGDGWSMIKAPGGGCCSPLCAGGCYERDRPDRCIACKNVIHKDRCMLTCDPNLFEYEGQCLDRAQCEQIEKSDSNANQCSKNSERKDFKAVRLPGEASGRCQENCPPGFEEDPTNKHRCKPCDKGKCRKVCTPQDPSKLYMVTNVNSLRELSDCNVINGSLEISMKGGKFVLTELETAFADLEEISGYLKITRTHPIATLEFLRNLKFINGSMLDRGQYSLLIIDNPNLQELFVIDSKESTDHKHLSILGGKIFVHLNHKLCPHKIDSLKRYTVVADWDEKDVSIHNNGDKEACNTDKLDIELDQTSAHYAVIRFKNFAAKLDDPRSLLFYLINYREAPTGNVTMFDGRDGCNSQNDVWTQVEEAPTKTSLNSSSEDYQKVIIEIKPATRYALYVKTFTIMPGSKGALSDMMYFETAPDTPGIPRKLVGEAISYDTISISWLPPSKPNGKILYYTVTVKNTIQYEELQGLDVCNSIIGRDTITKTISQSEPSQSTLVIPAPANDTASGSSPSDVTQQTSCPRINSNTNLEIQESKVTFQDTVIDIVYLSKNTCSAPKSGTSTKEKKKRSIEHEPTETVSISENSLPRKTSGSNQSSPRASTSIDQRSRSIAPMTINFNRSSYKTETRVVAPQTKVDHAIKSVITGLEHYKLYEIEVIACHGEFVGVKARPSSSYSKCGLYAVAQVRTKAIPENDRVNASSIQFYHANETNPSIITWEKPPNPNGLNLAFRIRYRLKHTNLDVWNEVCINITTYDRDRGLILSNIGPGKYVLSVQTISMYTEQRLWSDEFEFDIEQTNAPITWVLVALFIAVVFVIVPSAVWYTRKKARDDLIYASVNPDYVQYNPDEWEVDKSKLIVGPQIGTGSFGMVYKGQLITEKGIRDCAVKTVPPTSTAKQRFDFLREASIMKQSDTFHVVKLLGVVSVTTPVYVIMEYMENGDLKDFLRQQRDKHQKQNKNLVDGIYLMAAQIADGMAYLASKKLIHRDLAARNCMVGENQIVKVGDFGLTRDIYENDYYRRDTQGRLPVRWMAPESLGDNLYTSASDVWSYGIVLWEMVTFSAYPYQGLSNDEVIKRVISGYTMPRPEHCPDKLFNMMERCWRKNDKDRPTFLDLVEYLLPDTEGKLYPNCYYRKPKVDGDSIAHTIPDDSNTGTESYPLLPWPSSHRANGLTNGDNHIMNHNHSSDHGER